MPTLGRYELLEELSSGSMGTVYLSRDTVLDRRVALKTILPGTNLDGELKERFYREARACAQLHHPSIVTIYDFGEQDGVAYIAMELLDGSTLKAIIQERRPIPLPRKLDLSARICDGLAHAHAKGVVHRDVKPSNILVVNESTVKILDFGIARTAASSLTVVGRVLGTPHYMAPEQILGKPCDARSDLFSAAIVIFELLSWTHPFQGQSIPRRIVRETADSLLSADPNLPASLGPVLAKGLAKEPEGRYQTGTEFAAALRAVLREIAGSGTSTGTGLRTAIFDRPVEPPPPARKPRAGESTEYRMSEVLVLLREFDDAMDQNNLPGARAALKKIREAAEGDERFEGAVNQSTERLRELESQLPAAAPEPPPAPKPEPKPEPKPVAAAPAPPPPPAPTAPKPEYKPPVQAAPPPTPAPAAATPSPPASTQTSSAFGDATSLFSVGPPSAPPATAKREEPPRQTAPPRAEPPRPVAPQSTTALPGDSTRTQYHEAPRQVAQPPKPAASSSGTPPPATPPPARKPQAPPPSTSAALPKAPVAAPPGVQKPVRISPLIFIAAGVVFLLVVIGVLLYVKKAGGGNAPILPSVASAEVISAQTNLMSSPLGNKVVATAHRGDRLNVLVAPRLASQEWSEVQFIQGSRSYPRSYAHTADLGKWTSAKSATAFQLVTLFGPSDLSNRDAVRDQLARLDTFIREFSGTPEEGKAHLEEARLHVALAKLAASAADAKPDLDAASGELDKAANQPDLAGEVTAEKQEIAAAQQAEASTAAPAGGAAPAAETKEPALAVDAAINRANSYWQNGDYTRGIRLLKQYPNNAQAQQLLKRIQNAQRAESTTQ